MLLDTNILIYAINADSPKNKEAQKFLESPTSRLEITHQNILEAIRVLTHLKYSHPMKLQDALSAISEITIHLEIVTPNKTSYYLALELIKKHQLIGNRIFDAYLAATALSNDITEIATDNDRDFKKFVGLKVVNPFK